MIIEWRIELIRRINLQAKYQSLIDIPLLSSQSS